MFDHIGIGVSDLKASKDFFLKALSPLGVAVIMEFPHAAGLGRAQKPFLWLGATQGNPLPLHIAFAADNRTQVDQFYRCGWHRQWRARPSNSLSPELLCCVCHRSRWA